MPISRCRCLIEIQSTIHKILLGNQILVIEWCHTNELFILVFERTSNKQTFVMVSISIIAFLTSIWTDFIFAPTYFKLLPCLNFGSDFLLLAKILNQQPCTQCEDDILEYAGMSGQSSSVMTIYMSYVTKIH